MNTVSIKLFVIYLFTVLPGVGLATIRMEKSCGKPRGNVCAVLMLNCALSSSLNAMLSGDGKSSRIVTFSRHRPPICVIPMGSSYIRDNRRRSLIASSVKEIYFRNIIVSYIYLLPQKLLA